MRYEKRVIVYENKMGLNSCVWKYDKKNAHLLEQSDQLAEHFSTVLNKKEPQDVTALRESKQIVATRQDKKHNI